MNKWVIELRNGSYFQNLDADEGGPIKTAQRFDSKEAAEEFMDHNLWIYHNGGMAIPALDDVDRGSEMVTITLPKKLCRQLCEFADAESESCCSSILQLFTRIFNQAADDGGLKLDDSALLEIPPLREPEGGYDLNESLPLLIKALEKALG